MSLLGTLVVWSTGGMAVVGLVHGFSMVEERTANALCTSTLGDAFVAYFNSVASFCTSYNPFIIVVIINKVPF
jgi:hypothetical protein